MRDFSQQRRVFAACMFTLIMWIIFALLFITVYFNALFPSTTYFGLSNYAYTEAPVDAAQKGDLVFYKNAPPTEGKLFVYINQAINEQGRPHKVLQTKIFVRTEQVEETIIVDEEPTTKTTTYYVVTTPGSDTESYVPLAAGDIIGSHLFTLPKVGYVIMYLNYNLAVSLFSLAIFALLLAVLPVMLILKRSRLNKLPSPFPEGIDLKKLNKEQFYILSELKHFFQKARMKFEKSYDCYKIFVPIGNRKMLFATIVYVNRTIQVLINHDFARPDGRVDRSGFITIYNAVELPEAKQRINSIYKQHFKPRLQRMQQNQF